MTVIVTDNQDGDEWLEARIGVVTASNFSKVIAKGQGATRKSLLHKMAAEVLTGRPVESYKSDYMEDGNEKEGDARALYEAVYDLSVDTPGLGLLESDQRIGASPDGMVSDDGAIEIKSVIPTTQIATFEAGKMPTKHIPQVQGVMWVWEREWLDFISYCPELEQKPILVYRQKRDDEYINGLEEKVNKFADELYELVERIKA